jgi:hypothetical protein
MSDLDANMDPRAFAGLDLFPDHLELIVGSAISPEVARERGYRTVTKKCELRGLGFRDYQSRVPALLIPIQDTAGNIATYQIRPDRPRAKAVGKALKYETVADSRMSIDVPTRARSGIRDPHRPLFVTEGARKADALVSAGCCAIALLGVWNWRGTNEWGGKTVLPDWDEIAIKGRTVYIVYDSDVVTKTAVAAALNRLKAFLEHRGAKVRIVYLAASPNGSKVGADDFLASGGTVEELIALATDRVREVEAAAEETEYVEIDGRLIWNRPLKEGCVPTQLANFTARIRREVEEDDGAVRRLVYEIEARLPSSQRVITVPASQFGSLAWACELGSSAIVAPGFSLREHARAAIQILSTDVVRETVLTHTGWRKVDGEWRYLHAGGAIGPVGPDSGTRVVLSPPLHLFRLPDPPPPNALSSDVRRYLLLFELAPERIAFPAIAGMSRAVLGDVLFSLFLYGVTGAFKTEFAALIQAHFGSEMKADCLPGAWSSTANANEMLAFLAKDTIVTIDDFVYRGGQSDAYKLNRDADRVFRAAGNGAGRARLTADARLTAGREPRCLVLSTGEEMPPGHSLRARVLFLELVKEEIESSRLTACQECASDGVYARVTASYIQWLAPRLDDVRERLRKQVIELRGTFSGNQQHRRSASIAAELIAGFGIFAEFLREMGGLSLRETDELRSRCWGAVREAIHRQAGIVQSTEPTQLFNRFLTAALASGEAHLAALGGGAPAPESLALSVGWTKREGPASFGSAELASRGKCVGWIEGPDLYLLPDAALKAAATAAPPTEPFQVSANALGRSLESKGLLQRTEADRGRNTARISVNERRTSVWHLRRDYLGIAAQPAHAAHGEVAADDDGPDGPDGPFPARGDDPSVAGGGSDLTEFGGAA